jgi:hypothetical protein
MSTNSDFEKIARTWLQDGPSQIADRSLQAALDEVHVTAQQRFGVARRAIHMNGTAWRISAAAVVAVLIIGAGVAFLGRSPGGVGGGPAATPTPSPTATATESAAPTPGPTVPPLTETFTSSLHGYSIKYPAGWSVRESVRSLSENEVPWADSEAVDYFSEGVSGVLDHGIIVGTQEVAQGTTSQDFAASTTLVICGTPSAEESIDIGGETGRLFTYLSCNGLRHLWAVVVHGTSAFHVVLINGQVQQVPDRVLFDEVLATFTFTD